MKSMLLPVLMMSAAMMVTGCADKEKKVAKPEKSVSNKKPLAFAEQRFGNTVIYRGEVANPAQVPQTALQNAAVEFRLAAQHFKSLGIEYFMISPRHKVPFMITNFDDLAAYCYPANTGYAFDDIDAGKTDLQRGKCAIEDKTSETAGGAHIWFIGKDERGASPVWSVEQVLNDRGIDRYIDAVMAAADIPVQNRIVSVTHLKEGNIIPR